MSRTRITVITPKGLSLRAYLQDVRDYYQLLWAFTYRNLRSRYAQTAIGIAWAVINPLITLIILGFVFGKIAKMDTLGHDPFLFTVVGLSAWTYFSTVVTWAGQSVVNAQSMIQKIYFPRILLPVSVSIAGLLDLLITLIILLIVFLFHQQVPSSNITYFPLFLVMAVLLGSISGIWVSALGIRYRDFHHLIPFILRIGLYASPVAYALQSVDPGYWIFFLINPVTGVLEGFRWCFFGGAFPITAITISLTWIVLLLIGGLFYFNHSEKTMADII